MKVHPLPRNRRITLTYAVGRRKELRRLPHVFEKVLELPFCSDADVCVVETPDSLTFTVATDDIAGEIRADVVEICPGLTKIVVRGRGLVDSSATELEPNLWRMRLPELVRPHLAVASYGDGEMAVTVPKETEDEIGSGKIVVVH